MWSIPWDTVKGTIKNVGKYMNGAPKCPCCKGTGDYNPHIYKYQYGEYVYWKGRKYFVCDRCKGVGFL